MDWVEVTRFGATLLFCIFMILCFLTGCVVGHYALSRMRGQLMDLIDIALLESFLEYGAYAIGWGLLVICPLELLVFGVMKAFRLLKL